MKEKLIDLTLTSESVRILIHLIENSDDRLCCIPDRCETLSPSEKLLTLRDYLESKLSE